MRQEDKLKEKVGNRVPYAVPEGYFESLKSRVMDNLPEYPEKPKKVELSVWQRIKPYAYLAAMFAGIWCMMQIFHRVSTANQPSGDEMAVVVYDNDIPDYYLAEASGADLELQDEIIDLYPDLKEFKRDLYAQL